MVILEKTLSFVRDLWSYPLKGHPHNNSIFQQKYCHWILDQWGQTIVHSYQHGSFPHRLYKLAPTIWSLFPSDAKFTPGLDNKITTYLNLVIYRWICICMCKSYVFYTGQKLKVSGWFSRKNPRPTTIDKLWVKEWKRIYTDLIKLG